MGKNEIDRLRSGGRLASVHAGHNKETMNSPIGLYVPTHLQDGGGGGKADIPPTEELTALDTQVAGHTNDGRNFGLLRYRGAILKPKARNDRESRFYDELHDALAADDPCLAELRNFVPRYYGRETLRRVDGTSVDCIVLEDLTRGYVEPCIMDVKIGRRTWDPHAAYEKILKEESKYQASKRELGFCIPGFQVYKLSNGKLRKYGKEYGKRLNGETTVEALRTFLNADVGWNRSLLVQLLVNLWRIQNWFRKQNRYHLYSSSILLIYDARRLRQMQNGEPQLLDPTLRPPGRIDGVRPTSTGLERAHSMNNNFDRDLETIRDKYAYVLEELAVDDDDRRGRPWATVRMIDFAHAFRADDGGVDRNYLDGVGSLVRILEGFLVEANARC